MTHQESYQHNQAYAEFLAGWLFARQMPVKKC